MEKTALLRALLGEPVLECVTLDPGYSGHASDVWMVRTPSREVVVRSSRWTEEPNREFWWGCKHIFGLDPRHLRFFEENAKVLRQASAIPVPAILSRTAIAGKEFLVVEKMQGRQLAAFIGQPPKLLHQLGVWLAQVHGLTYDFFGNLAGTTMEDPTLIHSRMEQAMERIVDREHAPGSKIQERLPVVLEELRGLPVPAHCCPVLIDLDPSQFLSEQSRLSALVDIEAYGVGPRELDFIGLEYVLDERAASSFVAGYTTLLDIPDLSACRRAYRYLYRLLGVQGSVDLDQWLARPELF